LNFTHTDRLCKSTFDRDPRTDTAPAECEPVEVEEERPPVAAGAVFGAGVLLICIAGFAIIALVAWVTQ
jgi:hypothetical protein